LSWVLSFNTAIMITYELKQTYTMLKYKYKYVRVTQS